MGSASRPFRGAPSGKGGEIDYRLARQHLISEYKKGRLQYQKNVEKYHRVVSELEATLKLKEKEDKK